MSRPIRVLVVDDSAFMCRAVRRMLSSDPQIEVVGEARDGKEALERIAELVPDVVTLDVEMPVMDGLTALRHIVGGPGPRVPVVMLSTLTQVGSQVALDALELGAFDFVPKPQGSMTEVFAVGRELIAKVRAATGQSGLRPAPADAAGASTWDRILAARRQADEARRLAGGPPRRVEAVLVGVSTGGPPALQHLACNLPASFGIPVLVAQHMPAGFTATLAERLNKLSPLEVREARDGDPLAPGTILIAPAGWHVTLEKRGHSACVKLLDASDSSSWFRPCIDILFASAARFMAERTLAVVMTGLGDDGTAGARALKEHGGAVWAQDEATSAVWGMPRSVVEAGVADRILALGDIPPALCALAPARATGR